MEPMKNCGMFRRLWHRRLRRLDREFMLPAIQRQCSKIAAGLAETDIAEHLPEHLVGSTIEAAARETVVAMWARFRAEPGQEHWRCECSRGSR